MQRPSHSPVRPKTVAGQVLARLRALADPRAAARGRSYFKEKDTVTLLGVKAAPLRTVSGEVFGRVKDVWTLTEATGLCALLARRPELEAKMVGVLVLGRFHRTFTRSLLSTIRVWISSGWYSNWAIIDGLCTSLTTPLLRKYPELLPRVTRWSRSPVHWLRRASVVTLVPFARRGEWLAESYAIVEALLDDREDLMHKACGWLLREAGKTDPDRLERFLLRYSSAIPRTTVRYAIERFPETQRRRLLAATRG